MSERWASWTSAAALRRAGVALVVSALALALATIAVAFLQDTLGVPNPSAVYLVAVVLTALTTGTLGAVITSVAAFLLYNYFFTEPRYTLHMQDPGVWLSVVLLLFVGIVVGQLTASLRARAETARLREREARALFRVSRALATRRSTEAALAEIATILVAETRMNSVSIERGDVTPEGLDVPVLNLLRRTRGDEPATWVKFHEPSGKSGGMSGREVFRVRIEANDATLGSVWATRDRLAGPPDPTETRLLSAAADQIGPAFTQDRLAADSRAAEVARQSDALKSALLQSVSHDLRTPLATIRAAAGTLAADGLDPQSRRESALAIDREAEYLNRLVTNLLDLSRIEAGVLQPQTDTFELDDVLARAMERLGPRMSGRPLEVDLIAPAVVVDPVLLDEAFTNVVENVLRHTPADAAVRISAAENGDGRVRLTIEDGGPGLPAEAIGRVFERFYRGPERHFSRDGTGIGLTVVRGLVEAMGGQVAARASDLGGLAIDIDLPRAQLPAELAR
jgi:two-component system sensor histidine kinase KdpD